MKVYRKMKEQKGNTMEQPNIAVLVDHDILLETKMKYLILLYHYNIMILCPYNGPYYGN